jgi:hypothetical protein
MEDEASLVYFKSVVSPDVWKKQRENTEHRVNMAFLDGINLSTSVILREVATVTAPHSLDNRREQCRLNQHKARMKFQRETVNNQTSSKITNFGNLNISRNTSTFIRRY